MSNEKTVKGNLEAQGGETVIPSALHDARQKVVNIYSTRVADDRAWMLEAGKATSEAIEINLGLAKDDVNAKLFRASTTKWIADQVATQYGDSVSPDEWVAVYQLVTLATPLTNNINSARISTRFLRVARAWVGMTLMPAEKGFREEWAIKPGFTEHLRNLIDDQVKKPLDTKALRASMSATAISVEQERIDGMSDAKLQKIAQDKLNAKAEAKPDQTTAIPMPADWTPHIAEQLASLIMGSHNLPVAETLITMLTPWVEMKHKQAATPVVPVAPPTLAVPIGSNGSLVRQVA